MTDSNFTNQDTRFVANRVDAASFPACDEIPVDFPDAAALESFLEGERNYMLTDHVCPCCGTHMVEIEKVGPVPIELKGLVGCLNTACSGADLYYLPAQNMRKLSKREFMAALDAGRKRGREYFGLPG